MAYTDNIKQLIASAIKTNHNEEITGQILQNILFSILDSSEELYKLIEAIQVGGVTVLQSFGDSETMSISQKVITIFKDDIYEKLSQETQARQNADITLTESIASINGQIETLQQEMQNAGKVDAVLVNGTNVVHDKVAYIDLPEAITVVGETLII